MAELTKNRRDMVDRRRVLKTELTKLAHDIGAVDRVITILDPDGRPEAPWINQRAASGSAPFSNG